jgi:hypothetical protein
VDTKVTAATRLDHLDAERLRDMLASPTFAILRGRIDQCLRASQTDCERKDDPRDIHRAQGRVEALRWVLALPDQILKEIQKSNA